jgi:hypothetical protein
MSEKIVVPQGMLEAACHSFGVVPSIDRLEKAIEAALLWLSENPIVPTEDEAQYMYDGKNGLGHSATIQYCMTQWQRRMFLAPEPKVPEEITKLTNELLALIPQDSLIRNDIRAAIHEAYRRGKAAR